MSSTKRIGFDIERVRSCRIMVCFREIFLLKSRDTMRDFREKQGTRKKFTRQKIFYVNWTSIREKGNFLSPRISQKNQSTLASKFQIIPLNIHLSSSFFENVLKSCILFSGYNLFKCPINHCKSFWDVLESDMYFRFQADSQHLSSFNKIIFSIIHAHFKMLEESCSTNLKFKHREVLSNTIHWTIAKSKNRACFHWTCFLKKTRKAKLKTLGNHENCFQCIYFL